MSEQFNHVLSDKQMNQDSEGIINAEEEDTQEQKELKQNAKMEIEDNSLKRVSTTPRNMHYNFAEMDTSLDENDSVYTPKKRTSRKKKDLSQLETNSKTKMASKSQEIDLGKTEAGKNNTIQHVSLGNLDKTSQSNLESLQYVHISQNHPQCIQSSFINYKGFTNLGATCYMNSALIIFYHFSQFRNLLDSAAAVETRNCSFINQLRKMFQALSSGRHQSSGIQNSFCSFLNSQDSFKEALSYWDNVTNSKQKGNALSQLDALNFIDYIFAQIQNEMDFSVGDCNYANDLKDLMDFHTIKVFPDYNFNDPPFLMAPLGLDPTPQNLIECIRRFFTEPLIGNKGNAFMRMVKVQSLFGFILNRYSFSVLTGATKICSSVIIPDAITFTNEAFLDSNQLVLPVELQLYAVVVHIGLSVNSGHYYTYLKPVPTGQWYLFNDSHVTLIGDTHFLQSNKVKQNACLVFYKCL